MRPSMSIARMPVSIEFSIARRKFVSETRALCICTRRRMWRQVPSSIHSVSTLSATTIQNSVLPISPIEVRKPRLRSTSPLPGGESGTSCTIAAGRATRPGIGITELARVSTLFVEQHDDVPAGDFGRHEVAMQTLDRILGEQRADEGTAVEQGQLDLERGWPAAFVYGLEYTGWRWLARREERGVGLTLAILCRQFQGEVVARSRRPRPARSLAA